MRLFVSVLLLAALSVAPSLFAQEYERQAPQTSAGAVGGVAGMGGLLNAVPLSGGGQAACPVVLTSARLNWPASYLPVTSAEKVTEPNLALGFQNASGKPIRSVTITAELRVKRDIYRLDATPLSLRLSFAGTKDLDKELSQLATIPLPKGLHEYGVIQVRLDQVLFADGTMWMAAVSGKSCSVDGNGLIAAK